MPGQIRRAVMGDATGRRRLGLTDLVYVRLDTLTGAVQVATLAGAATLAVTALPAVDSPIWVQATTAGSLTGWRVLAETIRVGWTPPVGP